MCDEEQGIHNYRVFYFYIAFTLCVSQKYSLEIELFLTSCFFRLCIIDCMEKVILDGKGKDESIYSTSVKSTRYLLVQTRNPY